MRIARTHPRATLWRTASLLACVAVFAAAYAAGAKQARPSKTHPRKNTTISKPTRSQPASEPAEQNSVFTSGIRDNNVGVVLMDAHRFSEAFSRFQTACIMVPDSDTGCLNSGIALLAMRQFDQAQKVLSTSAARDANSAPA